MSNINKSTLPADTFLGIELGSTRIKAVLIGPDHLPIASTLIVGRTDLKIICGHIVWKMSGQGFRTHMQT